MENIEWFIIELTCIGFLSIFYLLHERKKELLSYIQDGRVSFFQSENGDETGSNAGSGRTDGDDEEAEFLKGRIYALQGDFDIAFEKFKRVAQLNPSHYEVYFHLGEISFERGDYAKAVEYFETNIIINNDTALAYYLLGKAYLKTGRKESAIEALLKASEINSGHAETFLLLGFAYAALDKNEEAFSAYLRALGLNPELHEANNFIANVWLRNGQYDLAIGVCLDYLGERANSDTYSILANAYVCTGEFEKAADSARKAVALNPFDSDAFVALGNAYLGLEDYEEALKSCRNAIRIDERNAEAYLVEGNILYSMQHFAQALESYRKAIELDPRNILRDKPQPDPDN